jgi:hypothetical protein
MPRRSGGAGFALVNLQDVEYLKKAVSLVRWLGYPMRKPEPLGYGGGGYGQRGRLILGGFGGGGGMQAEDEHVQDSLGDGFGGAQVGFALINTRWLKLYPLVGAGGSGQAFSVGLLSGGSKTASMGSYGAYILAGVGVELRLPLSRHMRPVIGFRAGWRYSLAERAFGISPGLPPRRRGEPFFHLLFGFGIED